MKNTLMVLICILFSGTVNANTWVTGKVTAVEDYGSWGNGEYQVLISLSDQYWGGHEAEAECTGRFSVNTFYQGVTTEIQNRIFSMMMAALMADKTVGLYVDVAGPYCKVQIGKIVK